MAKDDDEELTSNFGAPVDSDLFSVTAGEHGPIRSRTPTSPRSSAYFDRRRIPERVEARQWRRWAHGYFEVTGDVTKYTRAKFLSEVGKRTDVFRAFSTVGGEKGSADLRSATPAGSP